MKISVKLVAKGGAIVETILVEQDAILEATMLVYKERFYAYGGSPGFAFREITFVEVKPPVYINAQS